MTDISQAKNSRRRFLARTGRVAAASALAGAVVPHVHAAEQNTIQVALVGIGGRGKGAAANALSVPDVPIKLVAIADVFADRMESGYAGLKKQFGEKVDVPAERRFVSFDGYKQAMDCLRPGDVVILTTPPAFRWVHFAYAIEKKLNVFMEKPVSVDGPSSQRMFKLGKAAAAANLKVGVGLMSRHCEARRELIERIRDGALGDLIAMRSYRMHAPIGSIPSGPKPDGISHLMYQVLRFHSFIWASGGCYSDFYIHSIDECCWMKDAWPVKAHAVGGRHYRGDSVDQNFDSYSVEYTFDDGAKLFMVGRNMAGCESGFSSYLHGSKGMVSLTACGQFPAKWKIYKGQSPDSGVVASSAPGKTNPYQLEWNDLIAAIRQDRPYSEVEYGVQASLVSALGRMAAHTGQTITYAQMAQHEHDMSAGVDKLTFESDSPLMPGAEGKYAVPQPGIVKNREY